MKLSRLHKLLALTVLTFGLAAGIAFATPGGGIVAAPVIARATVDADHFKLSCAIRRTRPTSRSSR